MAQPRPPFGAFTRIFLATLGFTAGACLAGSLEYNPSPGPGNQSFATRYATYYGTYGCNSCHTSAPALNVYGTSYKNAALALGGRTQANVGPALANIEATDSDSDGYTNIIEINSVHKAYDGTDAPTAAVALSANPTSNSGGPGTTVQYTVTLTNNGNFTDSYTLGAAVIGGQSWTTTITGSANNVPAAGTANFTVNVSVPGGATAGQTSTASVTAASQAHPSTSASPITLTTSAQIASPRYVNASTGTNTGGCTNAASPCKTITYAMAQAIAGAPGDTIYVANGTYNAALGEVFPIAMKSGVTLVAMSHRGATIDATGASTRVFTSSGNNGLTRIEGFVITGGLVVASTGNDALGGAILVDGISYIRLVGNLFLNNEAQGYVGTSGGTTGGEAHGGAIHVNVGSAPLIMNNLFTGNVARGGQGFGQFGSANTGGTGGNGRGGAIYANGGFIINNTFQGNQAIGGTGGFSLDGAGGPGGGGQMGAVYSEGANVINNIFASNSAIAGTGGGSGAGLPGSSGFSSYGALQYNNATATNNLFYQNSPGGDTVGSAFINGDPQFLSPPGNLHIALSSPARGAGTSSGAPSTDADGVARTNPPSIGAFEPVVTPTATDLNGDGRSDLLWRNGSTGQVYRMLMNGFSRSGEGLVYTEPNTAWSIVADADFNGDGIADLLWRNSSTGQLFLMPLASSGTPNGGSFIYTEPNLAWKIAFAPDLNGDGKADLLWWNSSTGQVYAMILNNGAITAQGLVYAEPNTNWRIETVGDFAGSGKVNQLLWRNASTGQTYLMTVNFNGSTFSQSGFTLYSASAGYRIIAAPDLNGDGTSDILWRNDNTGAVWAMLMSNSHITTEGQVYQDANTAWKIVATGDYNGDGRDDILWRNDTTGQVYMMLMNGMTIGSQALVYQEPNTAWKVLGPWEYRLP